jgi:hypothetical protein
MHRGVLIEQEFLEAELKVHPLRRWRVGSLTRALLGTFMDKIE